jgi:hypothetical protein
VSFESRYEEMLSQEKAKKMYDFMISVNVSIIDCSIINEILKEHMGYMFICSKQMIGRRVLGPLVTMRKFSEKMIKKTWLLWRILQSC